MDIYFGPRDALFENFLWKILKHTGATDEYLKKFISSETIPFFNMAFTSSSADEKTNYETFEQLGDATIGKFIVWSSYEKFPQLRGKSEAVEIVARMKINLGSKDNLSQIAENLGMWEFITASYDARTRSRKNLLEDVFEAFIGAVEFIILTFSDSRFDQLGLAYQLTYSLLDYVFKPYLLNIDYNILVDSRNRLKGIFDQYKEKLGSEQVYKTEEVIKNERKFFFTKVYDQKGNFLGEGISTLKKDSLKKASENAIITLERKGFKKILPRIYESF